MFLGGSVVTTASVLLLSASKLWQAIVDTGLQSPSVNLTSKLTNKNRLNQELYSCLFYWQNAWCTYIVYWYIPETVFCLSCCVWMMYILYLLNTELVVKILAELNICFDWKQMWCLDESIYSISTSANIALVQKLDISLCKRS